MSVEPHHSQPVRPTAGDGSQATVAVAGQHDRERAIRNRRPHALSETPAEREQPRGLGSRRIHRTDDLDRNRTPQGVQDPRGARAIQQMAGATTAIDAFQSIVIWRGNQPQLLLGLALHQVIVKRHRRRGG